MSFHLNKLGLALALTSSLAGCSAVVKTPYNAPSVQVPQQYQYDAQTNKSVALTDQWWTLFNDAQLNQLIDQVLATNSDLSVAGITLNQARLQAGLAANQQGIRTSSSVSTGHNYDLRSGDGSDRGLSASVGVSYELDLFGKLANQTEASRWEALASAQDLQATAQSLVGTTAKLYWQLGYLNERYQTVQQNLASTQKIYNLVQS
jgi:outer membrane protein TolC